MFEMKLPDIGEGVAEAELISWEVEEGQFVNENEPLAEFLTDKASVEIPSPVDGKVVNLMYKIGDTVDVGNVFIQIEDNIQENSPTPKTEKTKPEIQVEKKEPENIEAKELSKEPPKLPPRPGLGQRNHDESSNNLKASPAVRAAAKKLQIDLNDVKGTGPNGRILDSDLHNNTNQTQPDLFPPEDDKEGWSREAFLGIRRRIAENMHLSKQVIPHFTYVEEINVSELEKVRKANGHFKSPLPIIALASIQALQKYPILNSSLDPIRNEIITKKEVDLGIAVATEQGLIVPVIHDSDQYSLDELNEHITKISQEAKTGKIESSSLKGGSFTISSLGKFGGLMATPIIRYPEVAILGVHAIRTHALFDEQGQAYPAQFLNLSLSVDHRLTDGIIAAQFIKDIKDKLESPDIAQLLEN